MVKMVIDLLEIITITCVAKIQQSYEGEKEEEELLGLGFGSSFSNSNPLGNIQGLLK